MTFLLLSLFLLGIIRGCFGGGPVYCPPSTVTMCITQYVSVPCTSPIVKTTTTTTTITSTWTDYMCTKTSTETDETTTTTTSVSRYPYTEYTTTTDYEPGLLTTYTTTVGNQTETITLTVPCYYDKEYITTTETSTTTVHDTSPGKVVAISLCSALFGLLLAAAAFACFLSRKPKKKSPPTTPVPAPYTPTSGPATY